MELDIIKIQGMCLKRIKMKYVFNLSVYIIDLTAGSGTSIIYLILYLLFGIYKGFDYWARLTSGFFMPFYNQSELFQEGLAFILFATVVLSTINAVIISIF